MAAILNFKFTQKRIIKNILAFRSRRITIFMSKFTSSASVTANMPLKMTPDGFNLNKQKSPLSLGKTHYSLYSCCCSTDFQGHPRSM